MFLIFQDNYFKDLSAANDIVDLDTVVFHTQPGGGAVIHRAM